MEFEVHALVWEYYTQYGLVSRLLVRILNWKMKDKTGGPDRFDRIMLSAFSLSVGIEHSTRLSKIAELIELPSSGLTRKILDLMPARMNWGMSDEAYKIRIDELVKEYADDDSEIKLKASVMQLSAHASRVLWEINKKLSANS